MTPDLDAILANPATALAVSLVLEHVVRTGDAVSWPVSDGARMGVRLTSHRWPALRTPSLVALLAADRLATFVAANAEPAHVPAAPEHP